MRIQSLSLQNVGLFRTENLTFINQDTDNLEKPPIIIFTGENGTGKSIVIDSIRALLVGHYSNHTIERFIIREKERFSIVMNVSLDYKTLETVSSTRIGDNNSIHNSKHELSTHLIYQLRDQDQNYKWIVDYWTSKESRDSFSITSLQSIKPDEFLLSPLTGKINNSDITKIISYFDYLRASEDDEEKELGEYLFQSLREIINASITDASFSHISRTTLTPFVSVGDQKIEISKLSSGNLYLIQRLGSLLAKAYALYLTYKIPIREIRNVRGLLLIDEIENHFHPKWQKKILNIILSLFPNLQIILTTHSPFIITSVQNSKVFVCQRGDGSYTTIAEETDYYTNKPIEEVLRTPLFETDSFNLRISELLEKRKQAISNDELDKAQEIEQILIKINPEYFKYLSFDQI